MVNRIFNSCSYVIVQDGKSWLVDCGDVESILHALEGPLCGVLLTHAHFDHIYGLNQLLELFPDLPIYTGEDGLKGLLSDRLNFSRYYEEPFVLNAPDNVRLVDDSQEIVLMDGLYAVAVATPGHSPGCITWVVDDAVFTGDSFIPGVKTVTIFPQCDKEQARQSEQLIKELAKGRHIYPGHAPQNEEITN